jgi:hypothetical protein
MPVHPGSYRLTAELDSNGAARTTSATAPVTIMAGATTQQTRDFPESSFLSP